jgi:hypothetical protein
MKKFYQSEQNKRIKILLKTISTNKGFTRKEIIKLYEKRGLAPIERTQFVRDRQFLKLHGIKVACRNNKYFLDSKIPKLFLLDLDEDTKYSLPILFNILSIHEEVDSVIWLKDVLEKDYGIIDEEWHDGKYFSSTKPVWNKENNIIQLSIDLIKKMKDQEVITFEYKPVNTYLNNEIIVMAPLQVRFYDGRYYLFGVEYKNTEFDFDNLRLIEIDQIRQWRVDAFFIDKEPMTFDYDIFFKKMKVNYLFEPCLGVVIPKAKDRVVKRIEIEFRDWAKSYVKNKHIHHSQRTINETKDSITVEISVYDTYEVEFLLGRFREEYATRINK